MPMRPPGPSAPRCAHTAGTLLVRLCAVGTLTLLVTSPAISGNHSIVAPGPSAPNQAPVPEFHPRPGPGPV